MGMTNTADTRTAVTQSDKDIRLFRIAVANAERNIGKAIFDFQPEVIRKALVASEILTIVNGQDDELSDSSVRRLAGALEAILDHAAV
jgi:hypothetical protein